jgi:hypothetical protein
MSALPELGTLSNDTLAGLLFELASQLHVERTRRMALEAALQQRGLLTEVDIETAGGQAPARQQACEAADRSIQALLALLSESSDLRAPLRGQAPLPETER